MKRISRGFTLIELLVVIAIIGVLSSVVLASLNSARGKGADAAIKSQLTNLRTQAELYAAEQDGYYSTGTWTAASTGNCSAPNTVFTNQTFTNAITKLTADSVFPPICGLGASGGRATSWALSAPLKAGGDWCVDSTGASKSGPAVSAGTLAFCQ